MERIRSGSSEFSIHRLRQELSLRGYVFHLIDFLIHTYISNQEHFQSIISELEEESNGYDKKWILYNFLNAYHTQDINPVYCRDREVGRMLVSWSPQLRESLGVFLSESKRHKTPYAIFLSACYEQDIPEGKSHLAQYQFNTTNMKTLLSYREWFLCKDAETFMIDSVQTGEWVVINNGLLVKMKGKIAALCVVPMRGKQGIFLPNCWYCPVDFSPSRFPVSTKVSLDSGTWALMRHADMDRLAPIMDEIKNLVTHR